MCVCGGGGNELRRRGAVSPAAPRGPAPGPGRRGTAGLGAAGRGSACSCRAVSTAAARAGGERGEERERFLLRQAALFISPPPPPLRVVGFGFFFPLKSSVLRRFRPPGERLTCTTPRRGRESPPQRRRGRALSGSRGWAAAPPRSPPQSRSRCFYGNCSSREPAPSPGRKVGAVSSAACLCGAGGRRQSGRG